MLIRDGAVVPLAPKALRTLLALVEQSGGVVTKQDLLTTVWPDSFVADTGLTRNISVLRQALGEDGEGLIATVARVGYRFTGAVELQVGAGAAVRPSSAFSHRRTQIVGRDNELAALRRAFELARQGPGRMIAITGEPGIGKSTVVDLFLEEIAGDCRIARGICTQRSGGTEPHLPILEVLDELTTVDATLTATLGRTAPTWLRHVAVSQEGDDDTSKGHEAKTAERLMRELTLFLEAASVDQPLAISIEDLHWTDASTVDVLAHLAARLDRMRLLIVITYREHELALRDHPFINVRAELVARGQLEEVPVSLLTPDDVRQYVSAIFEGDEPYGDLSRFVFDRTEGNPLFMADLVRYLQTHTGALKERALGDVPDSLRALIERMLGELQPASRNCCLSPQYRDTNSTRQRLRVSVVCRLRMSKCCCAESRRCTRSSPGSAKPHCRTVRSRLAIASLTFCTRTR
jgi:DNA-binding winged helix-turn-helix (wHTH) protein